jgi:Mrp family chromosome partitioning ATPase
LASDHPLPEPRDPHPHRAGRQHTTAVRDGTLLFALVLAGFTAYALGAPTTYRATAIVAVEAVTGTFNMPWPDATEATARMRRVALEPALLARLANEEQPAPPETPTAVVSRIEESLSVESSDGRRFTFAATASSPERSQRIVNELAQQAAKGAVQALHPPPPAPKVDPAEKAKTDLLLFLAAHPGIAAEESAAPARSGPDPLVLALRAERTRIEARLAQSPAASTRENPYEEPPLENSQTLRRRLKEIDAALEARAKPQGPAPVPIVSPRASEQERAEWQRLLRAAAESKPEPVGAPTPRLRATLERASLPELPIKPDRANVMLLGILVSSLAGVMAGLLRGSLEARALRRYGVKTGASPVVDLQTTTLRITRDRLPKPIAPQPRPLPTPVPDAHPPTVPNTPIPSAPRVPTALTPFPPAPIAPAPITPVPPAPIAPTPITPVPPAPGVLAPVTPIPPANVVPTQTPPADEAPTPHGPPAGAALASGVPVSRAPLPTRDATPLPELDGPPTTLDYGEIAASKTRRTTKIYGTPPAPDRDVATHGLRTTQADGSVPVTAIQPYGLPASTHILTPVPAEVLPRATSSLNPSPMITLGRSSVPPVGPSTRSAPPLAETSYSYVSTPLPPPPARSRQDEPSRDAIPMPPPPRLARQLAAITPHPVNADWQPEASLVPDAQKPLFREILASAVAGSFVVGICGASKTSQPQAHVACEIALGLAALSHPRILLIEGDLNFPRVHKLMNLAVPMVGGFSRQVLARVQNSAAPQWHVTQCSPSLHVLAEGRIRSPGLLLSKRFEEAVRELRGFYDIIVISAPSAPSEPEARALSDVVDAAVVVQSKQEPGGAPELTRFFSRHRFVRVLGA